MRLDRTNECDRTRPRRSREPYAGAYAEALRHRTEQRRVRLRPERPTEPYIPKGSEAREGRSLPSKRLVAAHKSGAVHSTAIAAGTIVILRWGGIGLGAWSLRRYSRGSCIRRHGRRFWMVRALVGVRARRLIGERNARGRRQEQQAQSNGPYKTHAEPSPQDFGRFPGGAIVIRAANDSVRDGTAPLAGRLN